MGQDSTWTLQEAGVSASSLSQVLAAKGSPQRTRGSFSSRKRIIETALNIFQSSKRTSCMEEGSTFLPPSNKSTSSLRLSLRSSRKLSRGLFLDRAKDVSHHSPSRSQAAVIGLLRPASTSRLSQDETRGASSRRCGSLLLSRLGVLRRCHAHCHNVALHVSWLEASDMTQCVFCFSFFALCSGELCITFNSRPMPLIRIFTIIILGSDSRTTDHLQKIYLVFYFESFFPDPCANITFTVMTSHKRVKDN